MKFSLMFLLMGAWGLVNAGLISHDLGDDDASSHHGSATSYQNIHIEHFHPVPTYIKKEDKHLLEHPISIGQSSSQVEIHHGGKHDHGYAVTNVENSGGHGAQEEFGGHLGGGGDGGHEAIIGGGVEEAGSYGDVGGHQEEALGGYQIDDHQQNDYAQYQEQLALQGHDGGNYESGADLGQHQYEVADGAHQEIGHY